MVSGVTEAEIEGESSPEIVTYEAVDTFEPAYSTNTDTTLIQDGDWDHEDAEDTDDGEEPEGDEWDEEDAENEEETEDDTWDDDTAENEEGTTDEEDEETEEDAENNDDNWDHEDAEDTDDGEEPEGDEWDEEDAENTDDEWDHEDAENTDDGDDVEEEEETEDDTGGTRTRSYIYPHASPDYEIELNTSPETLYAGEPFTLEGEIQNEEIEEGSEAVIYVNGEEMDTVTINEDGTFESELTIEESGEHELMIEALGDETESTLEVLEDSELEIDAPQIVSPGQQFTICAETGSTTSEVTLMRNGDTIDTEEGSNEVCFETTAPSSGNPTYTIATEEAEEETTVEVRDTTTGSSESDESEGGFITGSFLYQTLSGFLSSITSFIAGIFSSIVGVFFSVALSRRSVS